MMSSSLATSRDARHALDDESRFRLTSRRNKLFGLWAAAQMDLPKAQAESYAKEVVTADLDEPGDDDVLRKVHADLARHDLDMPMDDLRRRLEQCQSEARQEILPAT